MAILASKFEKKQTDRIVILDAKYNLRALFLNLK